MANARCCRQPLQVAALLLLLSVLSWTVVSCNRSGGGSSNSSSAAFDPTGLGDEVTADPTFELAFTLDGKPLTFPAKTLTIYESKPASGAQKIRPQGFELEADGVMIAGFLPEDLKVAPGQNFQQLVGKSLTVHVGGGGDPNYTKLSRLSKMPDGNVYKVESGKLNVEKAFYRKGAYGALSGTAELKIQPFKLGDTDDPNNKGDQPIGEPKTVNGTFTSKVISAPYEG